MSGEELGRPPIDEEPPKPEPGAYAPSVAERLATFQRAGGIITPVFTAIVAFFVGGLIVLATGHNPWEAYKAIFDGSGLSWFFDVGSYKVGIPWPTTRSGSPGTRTTSSRSRRRTSSRR